MGDRIIETTEWLVSVLDNIHFAPSCVDFEWKFQVEGVYRLKPLDKDKGVATNEFAGWFVNTTFRRPDTNTGDFSTGAGRKEFIPVGTTESGVVKTCLLLCKLIVEHEIMESFCYNGARPFDPHNTIQDLSFLQRHRRVEMYSKRKPRVELL